MWDYRREWYRHPNGLPGDKIFYENGTLFINDKAMEKRVPTSSVDFDWLRDADFQRDEAVFLSIVRIIQEDFEKGVHYRAL